MTSDESVVHENEYYRVIARRQEYRTAEVAYQYCYGIINIATGVTELYEVQLPAAIQAAEHLNMAMMNRSWEWIRKGKDGCTH